MPLPRAAARRASAQFGVISRRQLLRWLTRDQIGGLVRRGHMEAIHRGVYRVRGGGRPPEQNAMAAVLRTGSARIAGPFLLGLHGAEGFSRDDPFVVLAPPGRWPRGIDFPVSRDPCPGRHHALWDGGLPTATPTLGLVDLAHPRRGITDRRLRIATDSLRWTGRTTTDRLRCLVDELPRHLGARRLRRMFDALDLVSESEKERDVGAVLDGITPRPTRQAVVCGCRVDFLFVLLKLIVEYDGEVHDRPDRRVRDDERDGRLRAAGYEVLHLRQADLADPDALRARIVAVLRRRARELGVDVEIR